MLRDNSHGESAGQTKKAAVRSPSPDEARAFGGLIEALDAVEKRVIYIDKVVLLLARTPTTAEQSSVRRVAKGRRVARPRACKPVVREAGWECSWTVSQPSPRVLRALRDLDIRHGVCSIEIALDLHVDDPVQRTALRVALERHLVVRHRLPKPIWQVQSPGSSAFTTYFAPRSSSRNAAIYDDRPSKITGRPALHVELRLLRKSTLARDGLETLDRVTPYRIKAAFNRRMRLFAVPYLPDVGSLVEAEMKAQFDKRMRGFWPEHGFFSALGDAEFPAELRQDIRCLMATRLFNLRRPEVDEYLTGAQWAKAPVTALLAWVPGARALLIESASIRLMGTPVRAGRPAYDNIALNTTPITPTTTPPSTLLPTPISPPPSVAIKAGSVSRHPSHQPAPYPQQGAR